MVSMPTSSQAADPRTYVVIPARLNSTRLPRKLLLSDTGQPLIKHTYQAAAGALLPGGQCVATDDPLIAHCVEKFGGQVRMTDPSAASGTDRVAEVARDLADVDIIVNVQGDEPELDASCIDQAIRLLQSQPLASVATLATPIRSRQQLEDPACVKVVTDHQGYALYFSRSVIPSPRQWDEYYLQGKTLYQQHVGIYAYRRSFLLKLNELPTCPLEQVEKLEQLRILYAGHRIMVGTVDHAANGIDTAADYRAFVQRYQSRTMGAECLPQIA